MLRETSLYQDNWNGVERAKFHLWTLQRYKTKTFHLKSKYHWDSLPTQVILRLSHIDRGCFIKVVHRSLAASQTVAELGNICVVLNFADMQTMTRMESRRLVPRLRITLGLTTSKLVVLSFPSPATPYYSSSWCGDLPNHNINFLCCYYTVLLLL